MSRSLRQQIIKIIKNNKLRMNRSSGNKATDQSGETHVPKLWYDRSLRQGRNDSAAVGKSRSGRSRVGLVAGRETDDSLAWPLAPMLVLEEEGVNLLETCLTMRAFVGSNPGRLVICAISELFLLLVASGPPATLAPLSPLALVERNRTLAGDSAVGTVENGEKS